MRGRRVGIGQGRNDKEEGTYAERDAREVVSAERLDGGRQRRGIVDEHGGSAGERRNETQGFKALPEARSELVGGCGELGEQALLRAGHRDGGGDEGSGAGALRPKICKMSV